MKAVIPAAGLGSRLLPATKAQPKEMMPVVDKPVIQYVVEEAVDCGIEDILIVTGRGKRAIEDHFDRHLELEASLRQGNKHEHLRQIRTIADMAQIHYTRQKEAIGLGHAISCARSYVADEPFLVLLGDTISWGGKSCSRQLLEAFKKYGKTVIAVEKVPLSKVERYGIVEAKQVEKGIYKIDSLVEKPEAGKAPSNLAIFGRYILTPSIFEALEQVKPGFGQEIQLTDALALLLKKEEIYAIEVESQRYDIGSKIDWLIANIEIAAQRADLQKDLLSYLKKLVKSSGKSRH